MGSLKLVEHLAAKAHRGIGPPAWADLPNNLSQPGEPGIFYKSARDRALKCARGAIAARRPINKPAECAIAKNPFEVLETNFVEFAGAGSPRARCRRQGQRALEPQGENATGGKRRRDGQLG